MRKNIFPLLLAILMVTTTLHAQAWRGNARLQGSVVDQKTGNPIAGAKVALRMKSNSGPDLTTNAQGKWSVLGLGSGSWDIDVTAPGYVTKALSLFIAEGERIPPMKIELEAVVVEEAPPPPPAEAPVEEVKIGGVAVSPDVAAAVEAGNGFVAAGKFKEAVEQYEKAYPLLSSNLGLKVALARAYYGTGDLKKSVALLNEAYQIDPGNVGNVMMLAQLLLEDGQLDRGKEIIEKLPAGTLTDPTALINIGILLINKKQPIAAYDYFTKAIAIDANRAESYYFRGLAAVQSKQMKSARADFAKVLALAPDSNEAKEAKELLKSLE